MRQKLIWFLSLIWFLCSIVRSTHSRHIIEKMAEKNDTVEDDVDLEEVLIDYYDNLMEIWGSELKEEPRNATESEEDEKVKPKREEEKSQMNYNYLWGAEGDADAASKNRTKSYYDLAVPIQIGNFTYRLLNESYAAILDMQRANRARETGEANSTRIKDMRLSSIKDSVLSLRGGNASFSRLFPSPKQTKTIKEIFEKQVKDFPNWSISNMYTEKYQSFYPSCDLPRNTDENIWADPLSMNLFFDVSFATPKQESTLMIVNAVLRLYTISQVNFTFPIVNLSLPGIKVQMDQTSMNIPNFSLLNADDEKQIRISVYWHTKALRRQRMKKKLLDSQMMPLYGDHNLTFNIRAAVRSWKESGRNFGLLVTVEDEDGTLLEPNNYIHPMNCSKWAATVRPLPLFGFDSPAQYFIEDPSHFEGRNGTTNETNYDDEGSHFLHQPVKYPILSIQTREVPLSEMRNLNMLRSTKMELESRYYNASRQNGRSSSSGFDARSRKSGGESTSRVTDFENVPLGSPITQGHRAKSEVPPGVDGSTFQVDANAGKRSEEEAETKR